MTLSPRAAHAAYYAAHVGKSLLWTASDLVTIYALVGMFGVQPGLEGWLFLAGLVINAIADLAIGAWLDRYPKVATPLAMAGLVIAALAFPFTILGAVWGPAAIMAAMLVFRGAYAAFDVPHNAMLSRLGDTPERASRLSRGRTLGSGAAAIAVSLGLRAASDVHGVATLLVALALFAVLLGSALFPLMARATATTDRPMIGDRAIGMGLPWPFLIGSVIGIVALGALAKATLHLPETSHAPSVGATLLMLTLGRTGAALLPFRFGGKRGGMLLLAFFHGAAALLALCFAWTTHPLLIVALGVTMGTTNQIEWALMPSLSHGARSYGLFTMTSKLALGGSGLAMTAALGKTTIFTPDSWHAVIVGVAIACVVAALVLMRRTDSTLPLIAVRETR